MFTPGQGIRLHSSGKTDTGRVRDNNEDSIHLLQHADHTVLAVVADGMGGAVAGEEASRIAVETIETRLGRMLSASPADGLEDKDDFVYELQSTIIDANLNIVNKANDQPELKGMGTTVTLAYVQNTDVVIGHVGDSRAYLIDGDDGHIEQITSDHSFVQALVAAGHITEDEAEDHPMRNVLYRALGQAQDVEVDVYFKTIHSGDCLVLCSDGLTLHVKSDEIAEVAMSSGDPNETAQRLVDLANSRGGRDNVSVIVIKLEKHGDATVVTSDAVNTADSSQSHDLGGNEDSQETFVPRENTNLGTAEVPAIKPFDTQSTDTPPGTPPVASSESSVSSSTLPDSGVHQRKFDEPGEGRDTLLPEQ